MEKKKITIKCPVCQTKFQYCQSEWRPFCSRRCQQVDLGAWFLGEYVIASNEPVKDSELDLGEENEIISH